MTFRLFLLLTFFLVGRPQDYITFLAPLRPTLILTLLTLALTLAGNKDAVNKAFRSQESKKYVFFYIMMVLSIPLAVHRRVAFEFTILTYLSSVLYFYIFLINVDSEKKLKSVLFMVCCSILFYSTLGLIKGSGTSGDLAAQAAISQGIDINPENRLYFGSYDPNDLAFFLTSLFPLSILFMIGRDNILKKGLSILTMAMSVIIILLTGSRSGLLGLLCIAAVFFFQNSGAIKRSTKVFVMLVGLAVIGAYGYKINTERFSSLTNVTSDYNVTAEDGRLAIWKKGMLLVASNPVTGVGVNCFANAIGNLRADLGEIPKWQAPHNSYVQVAAETGLIGFLLFLSLIKISLRNLKFVLTSDKKPAESSELKKIATAVRLAFVGSIIVAFFVTEAYTIIFTLFFALSAVIRRLASMESHAAVVASAEQKT
jgi:O-antigen ligase